MSARRPTAPELGLIELRPLTRSAFLMKGVLAAGATYGAAAVGPWVGTGDAVGSEFSDARVGVRNGSGPPSSGSG